MSVIDSLRRPEHTGENRCLPCTTVNVALVVVVSLAVNVLSPAADLAVLVGGTLSIYLRGYVVPGTPLFTPQLAGAVGLADVFDRGDGTPDRRSESLDTNVDPNVMLSTLLNAGAFVEGGDGLFLAVDTREEWGSTMAMLWKATDKELAGAVVNAVPFEATVNAEFGGISPDSPSMSAWISRPQAIADVATLRTVIERDVDPMITLAATEPMRMFIGVYLDCGGPVGETTTRNCCGDTAELHDSPGHKVLGCADCGAVVYEFPDE